MKNKMTKFATLALCAGLAACSEYDAGIDPVSEYELAYDAAFIRTFGQPAADQDWGFGSVETRAAQWSENHAHVDWQNKLNTPTEAEVQVMSDVVNIQEHWKYDEWNDSYYYDNTKGSIYYIPTGFKIESIPVDLNGGDVVYNFGTITSLSGNTNNIGKGQTVTFYNAGTMTYRMTTGHHIIINTNDLTVEETANISEIYNSGDITFQKAVVTRDENRNASNNWKGDIVSIEYYSADLHSDISIYSIGGIISLPYGADWKATCHIDGIVYTDGYLHIQSPEQEKYICGIVSTDKSKNDVDDRGDNILIDSDITTSYIKTNNMRIDGDNIFLTKEGYITAHKISFAGDGNTGDGTEYEAIKVEANSIALVEADEFVFLNGVSYLAQHLGDRVYSNSPDAVNHYDKNNPNIGGNSACGGAWGNNDGDKEDDFVAQYRIIAEDLSATNSSDFDFNDIVIDVEYSEPTNKSQVVARAAGGTLPLKLEYGTLSVSIKDILAYELNITTTTMWNTTAPYSDEKVVLLTFDGKLTSTDARDLLKIYVEKEAGEWVEIKGAKGNPAGKICVKPDFVWSTERTPITETYELFEKWIQNPDIEWYDLSNEYDKE